MNRYVKFGSFLKHVRLKRGWKAKELAQLLELSKPEMSRIEAGKRKPSKKTLTKLYEELTWKQRDRLAEICQLEFFDLPRMLDPIQPADEALKKIYFG